MVFTDVSLAAAQEDPSVEIKQLRNELTNEKLMLKSVEKENHMLKKQTTSTLQQDLSSIVFYTMLSFVLISSALLYKYRQNIEYDIGTCCDTLVKTEVQITDAIEGGIANAAHRAVDAVERVGTELEKEYESIVPKVNLFPGESIWVDEGRTGCDIAACAKCFDREKE